jgi:sporulation protein YlmC with PRC-barrel domain
MKIKVLTTLTALVAAAFGLSVAQAQTNQLPRDHRFGRAVAAKAFINRDVVTQAGKNVGQIEEVMFDMESGHILYLGLNPKGAGKGDMVAVPPMLFRLPAQGQQAAAKNNKDNDGIKAQQTRAPLVVRTDEQALQGAPKFPKTGQEMAQAQFVDQVYGHFNQPKWWAGAAGSTAGQFNHIRRASQVTKFTVQDSANQNIGKIETVLFDLPAGRVSYVVLDPANSIVNKKALIPVPPMAFTKPSEGGQKLVLNLDKDKLNNAPTINRDDLTAEDIQKLSDPTFAAQVYNYYGKQPWFTSENIPSPTGPDQPQPQNQSQ